MIQPADIHSAEAEDQFPNQLLSSLLEKDYQALKPHLVPVELPRGKVLYEPGEAIEAVYFPKRAMISIVSLLEDGRTTEIGLIGNEGMVGLPVLLGHNCSANRAIVQVPDSGVQLDASVLKQRFRQDGHVQDILLAYTCAMFTYVSQLAACNRYHKVEQRFARWLLHVSDGVRSDKLPLTQEFIAEMLGSRRSSVTVTAQALQRNGIIHYQRGQITVLNRHCLEAKACECYRFIRNEFSQLMQRLESSSTG